jgi:hypothetical protein
MFRRAVLLTDFDQPSGNYLIYKTGRRRKSFTKAIKLKGTTSSRPENLTLCDAGETFTGTLRCDRTHGRLLDLGGAVSLGQPVFL